MHKVKGIPYGISDFNRMRNDNFYFVDKTMYLPLIEKMPSYLFLIRPRRFGKSVFLSMMRTYYDIEHSYILELKYSPPDSYRLRTCGTSRRRTPTTVTIQPRPGGTPTIRKNNPAPPAIAIPRMGHGEM